MRVIVDTHCFCHSSKHHNPCQGFLSISGTSTDYCSYLVHAVPNVSCSLFLTCNVLFGAILEPAVVWKTRPQPFPRLPNRGGSDSTRIGTGSGQALEPAWSTTLIQASHTELSLCLAWREFNASVCKPSVVQCWECANIAPLFSCFSCISLYFKQIEAT